jgi:hypothetical protein
MKHELITEALKNIADDYKDVIMALVEQAVTQGAIFGEVHMDVGNAVRRDLLEKVLDSPEFKGSRLERNGLRDLAEKQWPEEMAGLQSITLANGNKWLPNFDAKSAKEAFFAGIYWYREIVIDRLNDLFQDKRPFETNK